ncbi:hypothetical protein L593_02710 [Salinarchaeum sp. Harcht-Bsk1]|uniref:hypothetical protein n=1 Tax=Salinarchaeum sp. Harcht-Bsk1 TaxID=1333523 RepID=UPI000342322F|nr:hypothetical protein [Salinarchaeum sp. Harcht-Bsk1]AGN00493.1 hypothetical protein L593_02710 [Salinarchaeum sp. Harcht-Bsk1]
MLTVPEGVLERFRAFSLYNSPYRAHDDGSAIDLYPSAETGSNAPAAPSPVAGEVVSVERVRAPPKPYAPEHDVLLAVDTQQADGSAQYSTENDDAPIARILHVDPTEEDGVEVGDRVSVGDSLGQPIRAGFFAPWVGHHLHLGFRERDADLRRAAGSRPVSPATTVEAVPWDGRGTVVETADTYAVLDRPLHPDPGERFAAIAGSIGSSIDEVLDSATASGHDAATASGHDAATDAGLGSTDSAARAVALDGGLPHYDHGGLLGRQIDHGEEPVSLLGARIGTVSGRTAAWDDPTVLVEREGFDPTPIQGLSLAASRDDLGTKLICPDLSLAVGETVRVRIR